MRSQKNWEEKLLRDVCKTIQYGYTASATSDPIGPKILRITDIVPDVIDWQNVPYCDIKPELINKYLLKTGDIVVARTGATTGYAKYIKNASGSIFASYLVRLQLIDEVNAIYIGYILESELYKEFIKSNWGGAAQPNANAQILTSFKLLMPHITIQEKIATILSAYDDLIENNLGRIKILEEMAQNLYREWFVNFRFPGYEKTSFVDSPLGKIPEGWEVKCLSEITTNYDKLRKPLSSMERAKRQGIYPYYGAAKIIDYIDDYIFDGTYLLIAEDGSVITTEQKPVLQYVDGKFWANNHVHILKGKGIITTEHLYLALSEVNISGYITGAAQPKISQANLNRIPFLVPDELIVKSFNNVICDLFRLKIVINKKIQVLRQTRDLLLPKLISGEVDVTELDINISEEAAV